MIHKTVQRSTSLPDLKRATSSPPPIRHTATDTVGGEPQPVKPMATNMQPAAKPKPPVVLDKPSLETATSPDDAPALEAIDGDDMGQLFHGDTDTLEGSDAHVAMQRRTQFKSAIAADKAEMKALTRSAKAQARWAVFFEKLLNFVDRLIEKKGLAAGAMVGVKDIFCAASEKCLEKVAAATNALQKVQDSLEKNRAEVRALAVQARGAKPRSDTDVDAVTRDLPPRERTLIRKAVHVAKSVLKNDADGSDQDDLLHDLDAELEQRIRDFEQGSENGKRFDETQDRIEASKKSASGSLDELATSPDANHNAPLSDPDPDAAPVAVAGPTTPPNDPHSMSFGELHAAAVSSTLKSPA